MERQGPAPLTGGGKRRGEGGKGVEEREGKRKTGQGGRGEREREGDLRLPAFPRTVWSRG